MIRPNYNEQVKNRIIEGNDGCIYIASDFADIADTKTIHMSLKRLCDEGLLRKVLRGVYMKSRYSTFLNEYIPARPDDVARAIARNYGWNIIPSDMAALNLLGLSTQVPSVWEFISDGPYKEYSFDDVTLKFKHTNLNSELTQVSYKTALIIRALKSIGRENITEGILSSISSSLSSEEKELILKEAKYSTSWIFELLKVICRENKKEA